MIRLSDSLVGIPTETGGIRLYSLIAELTERDVVEVIAGTGRRASAAMRRYRTEARSPARARFTRVKDDDAEQSEDA
jgi:ribosomal protein L12E/L44/L45/RPP1/RPP2